MAVYIQTGNVPVSCMFSAYRRHECNLCSRLTSQILSKQDKRLTCMNVFVSDDCLEHHSICVYMRSQDIDRLIMGYKYGEG